MIMNLIPVEVGNALRSKFPDDPGGPVRPRLLRPASAASIEDQLRLRKKCAAKEGWPIVETYIDQSVSGASLIRPGIQQLLQDAAAGKFTIILAEALGRLSRDQEDIAHVYKRMRFLGVRIVTLSEGEVNELHIGLKGTTGALYLKDLADKTRRGLRGRIEAGKSGGGNSYGYDAVKKIDDNSEPVRGERRINEREAAIVRHIFNAYAAGQSPKAIAHALNRQEVPGPSGEAWAPSTVNGNWRRRTGILNNELYIGRLVSNRQSFVKDPDTDRRVARPNPNSAWIIKDVPELRISDQALWDRVKARQQGLRRAREFHEKRRPRMLLSFLLRCGVCGGSFSKVSEKHYGCSTARNKGTCDNRLTVRQAELEGLVLSALQERLMDPALLEEFCAEYTAHLNRLRGAKNASLAAARPNSTSWRGTGSPDPGDQGRRPGI
jgi:site-specific DNA recombinase